jgi:anthranilate phosphoribosyltransferase
MKTSFNLLCHGHTLSETEAYQLLQDICENQFNASQIAAIIAFYIARPITVNELMGFRKALLDVCVKVKLDKEGIDVCGTGGDQKDTFNVSTLSALVLAASGSSCCQTWQLWIFFCLRFIGYLKIFGI